MAASPITAQQKQFALIDSIYQEWKHSSLRCDSFYYADVIDDYSIGRIIDLFLEDGSFINTAERDTAHAARINFTTTERKYIIEQLKNLNAKVWPNNLFPQSKVIAFANIDALEERVNKEIPDPLQRLCHKVHSFSHPILLRHNTVCLFFSGRTDFATKEGDCWIYVKEGDQWKKLLPLYQWIE